MAAFNDQDMPVARVYSAAMLQLAERQGEVDALLDELQDIAAQVDKDEAFCRFLSSPTVDAAVRKETLEKLFRGRYSDLLVNSLQILNGKGRLGLLGAVAEAYRLAYDERGSRVEVRVVTATPLTDALRERLGAALHRRTGKTATLVETVDASMLGGLVVTIGDTKFDASVATKVRHLAGALQERASREIQGGTPHWE